MGWITHGAAWTDGCVTETQWTQRNVPSRSLYQYYTITCTCGVTELAKNDFWHSRYTNAVMARIVRYVLSGEADQNRIIVTKMQRRQFLLWQSLLATSARKSQRWETSCKLLKLNLPRLRKLTTVDLHGRADGIYASVVDEICCQTSPRPPRWKGSVDISSVCPKKVNLFQGSVNSYIV